MLAECQAGAYQSSREKTPMLYLHCSQSKNHILNGLLKFYYKATQFFIMLHSCRGFYMFFDFIFNLRWSLQKCKTVVSLYCLLRLNICQTWPMKTSRLRWDLCGSYEDKQIMMWLMWLNVLLLLHIAHFITSHWISSTYPHQISWKAGRSLPSDGLHPYVRDWSLANNAMQFCRLITFQRNLKMKDAGFSTMLAFIY